MTPGPFAHLIDDELGRVIARDDGAYDLVLERRLKRPIEKVWPKHWHIWTGPPPQ